MSEHTIPSLLDNHLSKKPMLTESGLFAQMVKGTVRMAFISKGYLDKKLSSEKDIRKRIRGLIMSLPEGTLGPTFTGT